jgi:hypothetical protein
VEGQAGEAGPDCTRRFIRGASRGCKVRVRQGFIIDPTVDAEPGQPEETSTDRRRAVNRGNPVIGQAAALNDLSFRVTWKLAGQRSQRGKEPGQPGSLPSWLDRWAQKFGETRRSTRWHNRMVQNPGETRGDHQPVPEDLEAGQPGEGSSAIPKDRNSGQPEARSLGTAEGCEIRGDSELHRRPSRRRGTRGNPLPLQRRRRRA